eukprot:scaffold27162_cov57-Phaeocystis_antarctica.AAC.1
MEERSASFSFGIQAARLPEGAGPERAGGGHAGCCEPGHHGQPACGGEARGEGAVDVRRAVPAIPGE